MPGLLRDRLGPRARLAVLVVVLVAAYLAFAVFEVVEREQIRDVVEPLGWIGALVFVPLSALLGMAFVPGPLLAGTSGLLFGVVAGTAVTLAASTLSAVLALLVGRRVGAEGMQDLGGERMAALRPAIERSGLAAVVVQRLAPAVPDAPCSYAFGTLGVKVWQIALGTVIGAFPRALAYTALGSTIDDLDSPLGFAAVAVIALVGVAGFEIARRSLRSVRRQSNERPAEP